MADARGAVHRPRVWLACLDITRVLIKSAAVFHAHPIGAKHLDQHRRHKHSLGMIREHDLAAIERRIDADEVVQRKRTDGHAKRERRAVDLGPMNALVQERRRFVEIR